MARNETGATFLSLLFMTALLLLYVLGQLPKTIAFRENLRDEWGKLQAERNAEAGAYLAVSAWEEDPEHFVGDTFILSNGEARVTVERDAEVLKIASVGSYGSGYKDELTVLYDTEQSRWVDWTR